MCDYKILLAVCLGLAVSPAVAQDQRPNPDQPALIQKWINQLSSPSYVQREKARAELDKIGLPALDALKKAMTSKDQETRSSVAVLIAKLEEQQGIQKLLAPKMVHLKGPEMPLGEIIKELALQTGYTIQIQGNQLELSRQRFVVDTGKPVPFWEAFDLMCETAGLTLVQMPVKNNLPPNYPPGFGSSKVMPSKPGSDAIVVKAGTSKPLPTFHNGAVRIQLASPIVTNNEVQFTFQVAAEPSMENFTLLGTPIIDRAIDEHGQLLNLFVKDPLGNPTYNPYNNKVYYYNPHLIPRSTQVQVYFKPGDKLPGQLKEFRGKLSAETLLPTEPLITLDNVMKPGNQTAKGKDGGELTLQSIKKFDNKRYQVEVHVDFPPGMNNLGNVQVFGGGQVIIQGNVIINGNVVNNNSNTSSLVLLDGAGKAFRFYTTTKNMTMLVNGKITRQMTILFEADAGQGEPAQLMLVGRRTAPVAIPFHFENVSLK